MALYDIARLGSVSDLDTVKKTQDFLYKLTEQEQYVFTNLSDRLTALEERVAALEDSNG